MSAHAILDVSTAAAKRPRSGDPGPDLVPALIIAAHPMPQRVGDRRLLSALLSGKEVEIARNAPDFCAPDRALGSPLADPFVSRKPIRFAPAPGGGVTLIPGDGGPVAGGRAEWSLAELTAGVPIVLADRVVLVLHLAPPSTQPAADASGMVGAGAGIGRVRDHLLRIADLTVPVLLRGETGTGKELVARAVHAQSPRRRGPFVSVNLGAIPRELAAAELFGVRRGAFTGATQDRDGFFAAARGGTLFLDEVGEAPPEVQAMLLRVLESGEMFPVGGQAKVMTDVRLVAATDADLEAHIREGRFKAPLLHRLAGYEVRLPALRERREDIGLLLHHFAQEELAAVGELHRLSPEDPYADPWLPAALARKLIEYSWPGNIRQLRNLTRQLVIGSRGKPQLSLDPRLLSEIEPARPGAPPAPPAPTSAAAPPRRKGTEVTEAELREALRASGWDLKPAADRLGIARSSLYDLIARCPGLRTAGDLSAEEITRCFHASGGDVNRMAEQLEVSGQALRRRLREMGLVQ